MSNDSHIQVALNVDLNYPLSEHAAGFDDDGDPVGITTQTLGDAVVERAAQIVAERMFAQAKTEIDGGRWGSAHMDFYTLHVKDRVEAMIGQHIEDRISDLGPALKASTGCDSLDAALRKIITEYLDEPVDRYHREKGTRLTRLVSESVGTRTKQEVEAVITDAKQKALAAIAQVGEQQLGAALRQSIAAAAGFK